MRLNLDKGFLPVVFRLDLYDMLARGLSADLFVFERKNVFPIEGLRISGIPRVGFHRFLNEVDGIIELVGCVFVGRGFDRLDRIAGLPIAQQ